MSTTSEEDRGELPISEYFQASAASKPSAASKLPLVHVYVGPARKLFIFPETLLCDRFKFFESAFQNGFRESLEKAMDLPEDDPVAFAYVIDRAFQRASSMKNKVAVEELQLALAKAYVLADKLGRPDLAREANEEYYDVFLHDQSLEHRPVCPRAIRYVYENSPETARLRHTMVDIMVTKYYDVVCITAEWMKKWLETATSHSQFHFDIMIFLKQQTQQDIINGDECVGPSCMIHFFGERN